MIGRVPFSSYVIVLYFPDTWIDMLINTFISDSPFCVRSKGVSHGLTPETHIKNRTFSSGVWEGKFKNVKLLTHIVFDG